jgi:cysteine synthase
VIAFVESLLPSFAAYDPSYFRTPDDLLEHVERVRERVARLQERCPLLAAVPVGGTPLLELPPVGGVELWAKLEDRNPSGSLKDRIVLYLLADGIERGWIAPDTVLIEGTSGNTGISLAMLGAALGYRVKVFLPDNVSEERRALMEAFGAEVALTPGELGTDGAIEGARRAHDPPRSCWLAQHENPANVLAHYDTTGAELVEQCPDLAAFVAPTGTTGTLMGASLRLKEHDPDVEIVAVWPEEWIMGLRRPVGDKKPKIYDERWVDRVIEIADPDARAAARELARRLGLLVGPSSGAAWLAARQLAEEYASQGRSPARVVVCFPDEGARYLSTGTFGPSEPAPEPETKPKAEDDIRREPQR